MRLEVPIPVQRGLALIGLTLSAAPGAWAAPAVTPAVAKPKPATPAPKPVAIPKPATPASKPVVTAPVKPVTPPVKPVKVDESVAFFRDGVVPRLKITISEPELKKLREKEREYVRCTVSEEGGKEYQNVGLHLKGAAGSFRNVDDKPALTLNFDKFVDDQEFHGLDKLHLNNSVQDPSYLDELVCSELFAAAKVPAARVTHARVWLNGRDLGITVLIEGFNKRFLKRYFTDATGNLYEGGFVQDLDGNPELQSGKGAADRSDVKAVVDACREGDTAKRWAKVEQLVNLDQFFSFAAMEALTCHWDGYCHNRNNYRFYFDPKSGKLVFFPHGMDQMFSDSGYNALDAGGSIVPAAIMSNPEWKARYRDRVAELIKQFVPSDRLLARVEAHHLRLRPAFASVGENQAKEFDQHVKELKNQLSERAKNLNQQIATAPDPRPLKFDPAGFVALTKWEQRKETDDAKLELLEPKGAVTIRTLSVATGPGNRCVASWRTKLTLPAGKYRLEGKVRTEGVKALQDNSGTGAGLRLSGGTRTNKLDGTAPWTLLTHEFEVTEPSREVEFVAELRATAGKAFFDAGSLRVVKAK